MVTADFFRARIDAMINLNDPLAVLATRLPWTQIEASLVAKFERQERAGQVLEGHDMFGPTLVLEGAGTSNAGRPKLPIRLMASLLYLKHSFNLSDEELVVRWSENVLWQFFGGMDYYEHRLPCDATQIGRFRRDLGEDGMEQLLRATIDAAVAMKALKPKDLERVIVDTTVQEKAIAHPVDSRLLEIARDKVVSAAKRAGVQLKQTFAKEGKELRRRAGGYAHAKQFRRLKKVVKRQRTILGIVIREVQRKTEAADFAPEHPKAASDLTMWLERAERIRTQQRNDKNKLYVLHAPEVECIGKVQGPQALRVRRQERHRGLTQTRPDAGCAHLPRQSVRRPHPERGARAGDEPAAGPFGQAQANRGRLGLPRRGRRQPRQADRSPRQVQEPESAAKGLAASAPSRRAGHRALEVRSPDGSMLAARRSGRCVALDQLRCRLQPALADARDRPPGSGSSFFAPAARGVVAGADHASITWRLWPHTGLRLNSTLFIAISSRYATAMTSRMASDLDANFAGPTV